MWVIDANNLWYAAMVRGEPLNGIARSELLRVLDAWAEHTDQRVTAVLDGFRPSRSDEPDDRGGICRRLYAQSQSADDVIARLVGESSGPGRLTVVTSDRDLARLVRHRRVKVVGAEAFAARLERWLNRPASREPAEPASKHAGLAGSSTSVDLWLRYFQLSAPKSDIMQGGRAGATVGDQSQRPIMSQTSPSPVVTNADPVLRRVFQDVQPLERRKARRRR